MIQYRSRTKADAMGRREDKISARLARVMFVAGREDYAAALPDYKAEALGFIRADGLTALITPILIFILLALLIPALIPMSVTHDLVLVMMAYSLPQAVLIAAFWSYLRDACTDLLGPEAALASRLGQIRKDMENRAKKSGA